MESDLQTVKKIIDFHNDKSVSKIIIVNSENKEEINMESTNSRINTQTSQVSLPTNKGVNNSNSPKMGSRRIFTPQFKLQVLESYRNDSDCKGNQRATARKYNIHRRQIQKWLQCESTLRSSVANINQNSVKHQFHNVSLQPTKSSLSSISSPSYTSNQLHSTHLCLDSTRGTVLSNTIKMPSLPTCVTSPSISGTHDIFETSNLVAVVAAATGSIAVTTSTGSSPATVVSPLRPSTIISANVNTNSAISPLIHHHYGISPYNNIYPQQHVHQTHPSHQNSYQYHMAYSPTLSHRRIEKNQSSYFTPISLPDINVLSAAASTSNCYTAGDTELTNKLDLISTGTKTFPKFISDKNVFLCNDNLFHSNYGCPESSGTINSSNNNSPFSINQFKRESTYSTVYPFGPMDLSLHHRREVKPELVTNIKPSLQNTADQSEIPLIKEWNDKIDVVDLTYRKRRILNTSNSCHENEFSEKYLKLSNPYKIPNESITYNASEISVNLLAKNTSNSNEDDDIEIEVGIEEKFAPTSKPVKLFKPYLLDERENKNNYVNSNINKISEIEQSEQTEQVSTSCFPNETSTKSSISNDVFIRDNTFPDIVKANNNNCVDSSNFHVESRSESPRSACSPATSVPTMSPTNFHYPKGSPASSGYESSTSSYSDSSLSPRNETYTYGQTYSVKLQMQSIYNENTKVINSSKHVQRWLEKDDPKPLTHNSSIALLV